MTTLRYRTPYAGARKERGESVPWEVSKIVCQPRAEGDPEPHEKLLNAIRKECVKEDGTTPSIEELKALNLQQAVREAFSVAFYDPLPRSWPSFEAISA